MQHPGWLSYIPILHISLLVYTKIHDNKQSVCTAVIRPITDRKHHPGTVYLTLQTLVTFLRLLANRHVTCHNSGNDNTRSAQV